MSWVMLKLVGAWELVVEHNVLGFFLEAYAVYAHSTVWDWLSEAY
jgi:hypothetical protein